jgi:hypothetical protein
MSSVSYDVVYREDRNRLTTAFRMILVIPHLILAGLWAYLAEFLAVIQWFIVLFTGKRNESIFDLQNQWLGYATRVYSYYSLMYDPYPPFGTEAGETGVTYALPYEEPGNRLTNGLRFIWAIPAIIIMSVLVIAGLFVALASWFAIVITGKHPRGMFDFLRKVHRYAIQTQAYVFLMTDTYPKYDQPSGAVVTPYPAAPYSPAPHAVAPPPTAPYPAAPPPPAHYPAAPPPPPPPPAAPGTWSPPGAG